jgi:hypothetical protein
MRLVIAGGRDYELTAGDYYRLEQLLPHVTEVVSGGARGADTCGEFWATASNIPVKRFPAEWDRYGQVAGFKRNIQMAIYADAVALFPGGKGTAHMFKTAKAHGLQIFDFRDNQLL